MSHRLTELRWSLPAPIRTARGVLHERRGLLLEVERGGAVGRGEASPLPGFSVESFEACRDALADLVLPDALPNERQELTALVAGLTLPPAASHAVEQALLELAGGLPVAGEPPIHALVRNASEVSARLEAGFRTLKVKVAAAPIDADVERVRAIREAAGDEVALRLDANGGWTRAEAREALGALAELRPDIVEEPLEGCDLDGMAALRAETGIYIAADESVRDLASVLEVAERQSADAVVLKPMFVGGPLTAFAMAEAAFERGLRVSVTHCFDGAVGRAGATALARALPPERLDSCGVDR